MTINECVICLEKFNTSIYKCPTCKNCFHNKCIRKLKQNNCPLCRSSIIIPNNSKSNVIFNNMDETNKLYNIDYFTNKWKDKTCLNENHKFILETLGDWISNNNNNNNLTFIYKCMYLECTNCKKNMIIN